MPALSKHITKRPTLHDLYWFEMYFSIGMPIPFKEDTHPKGYVLETITVEELSDKIQELRPDIKDHYFSNIADAKMALELLVYNPLSLTHTHISEFPDVNSMISSYNIAFDISKKADLISLFTKTNNTYLEEFYDTDGNRLYGISIFE